MQTTENQYLSFYIYYAEPWEIFLTGAIYPLMKKLVEDGWITQYFFIRYWEKGPHLRLRLKKKSGVDDEELSVIVQENLNQFILKNPSQLFLTPEMEEKKQADDWQDNNQIISTKYQPETARYGGTDAMPLAELQFFASSQIVLNEFLENSNWSYDHALGAAIKLHLGFVFSLGMTVAETVSFFEKNCRDWLPQALPKEGSATQKENILTQFKNAYSLQKSAVLPYINGIWQELKNNPTGHGSFAWENWLTSNRAVFMNLQLLQNNGILNLEGPQSESKLWNILSDFVHLTNNRLGVMNRDEGFLAFMLAEALKELVSPGNDI